MFSLLLFFTAAVALHLGSVPLLLFALAGLAILQLPLLASVGIGAVVLWVLRRKPRRR